MAALPERVKLAIVRVLACFDGPSEAVGVVKAEFGITISRQQAALYDPTKPTGRTLSPKLTAVFHATRAAFLKDVATIPIAHQAYRLRQMQRQLETAEARGNSTMVLKILEQAAKEVGGMFTNRREHSLRGGVVPASRPNVVALVAPGLTQVYASNDQVVSRAVQAVIAGEAPGRQ